MRVISFIAIDPDFANPTEPTRRSDWKLKQASALQKKSAD